MQLILYNPKDPVFKPPHKLVIDAMGRSDWDYTTFDDIREREEKHQADPKEHSLWPCAACDWKDPAVKKVRAKKKKALDRFIRTGKLPVFKRSTCGVARTPRKMTDEEAARVVLPFPPLHYKTCTAGLRLEPSDKVIERVASWYLEAMGEKRRDGGDGWSCGCEVSVGGSQDGVPVNYCSKPCSKHRGAFEGTEDSE